MTGNDLEALGVELTAADDAGDARRLAAIAWQLYAEAGLAQAEIDRLHCILRSFRSPACNLASATSAPPAPAGSTGAAVGSPAAWAFGIAGSFGCASASGFGAGFPWLSALSM